MTDCLKDNNHIDRIDKGILNIPGGLYGRQHINTIKNIILILGDVDYDIYKDTVFQLNGIKATTKQIKFVLKWLQKNNGYDLTKQPHYHFLLKPNDDNSIEIIKLSIKK